MSDPTFRRSTLGENLLALRAALAAAMGLDLSFVVVTAEEDAPHHRGNRDVLLVVGDERPDEDDVEGGGRAVALCRRAVTVVVRTRRSLDRSDADLLKLTDASLGHLAFEDKAVDACLLWLATDDSQNATALALPLGPVRRPRRDREDPSWLSSSFEVTVQYLRSVDQARNL